MKIKIIFIGVSVFLYVSFHIPITSADVIISEFTIGKYIGGFATNTNGDDFIELYNTGNKCVPLEGWKLRKRIQSYSSGSDDPLYNFKKGEAIMPNDFFLWVSSKAKPEYQKLANGIPTQEYVLSGNNSIALLDNKGSIKDAVTFGISPTKPFSPSTLLFNPGNDFSKERDLSSSPFEWKKDIDVTPTPTGSTSLVDNDLDGDGCPDPPPIIYDSDVRINELLANPSGDESKNEFIELFNTSDKTVDLSSWTVKDTSTGKYTFPSNTKIEPKSFLTVYSKTFVFALNNSNETVFLLDPNEAEKDKVSYKTAKEDVSYNYTFSGWRGGTPTPGKINQPNNLPETGEKVPNEGYKGVEVNFDAGGKDSDNDALKYTWDFGDGHKSYKEQTTHTYEENGTYTVTLKTTDGKDDTEETFTIKIESMPRKDVRITSLLPNPSGNDTGNEWLLIENREKKSVNLKDYSITTGWKKLSNHPIREDFIIKPNKEARLTQEFSSFSLPNQKGRIELRAPDGKVLQKIEYKLGKPVAEDAVYHKEKGSAWKWESLPKQIPVAPKKETVPLVPVPQEVKPAKIIQPIQEDIPIEPVKTKSDQISLDPDRPIPQDILAYGTRVQMPDSITLALSSDEKVNLVPLSESSPLPEEESLFTKINTSLNAFLNNSQEK